jgi:hypothetical protein
MKLWELDGTEEQRLTASQEDQHLEYELESWRESKKYQEEHKT